MVTHLRISFIEAPLWGANPGASHICSNILLTEFPEIDFDFRFLPLHTLADPETTRGQTKRLIGQNPHIVFFCAEWILETDRNRVEEFLTHLPDKSKAKIYLVPAPELLFAEGSQEFKHHLSHLHWIERQVVPGRQEILQLTSYFREVQDTQVRRGGNLYSLHDGQGHLTLFGQTLLAKRFLDKTHEYIESLGKNKPF